MLKIRKINLDKNKILYIGGKGVKLKKKEHKPFISVITVVKNGEKNIKKTLKSVFNQSYKNHEYIVIDGNSEDKTLRILKKYENKIDFLISQRDKNLWDAINKGIKLSNGKVIGILNSGDIYYKNTLKTVNKYFKNGKLHYLFGPVIKDRLLFRYEPEKINYRFNIYPSHSSGFFVLKKVHKRIGMYNIKYNFGSDYDFFYKIIKNKSLKGEIANKNEVFGKFDLNGISSKIPFFASYFYEMVIRFENGQNVMYLFFLYWIKIFNKIYRTLKSN